MTWEYNICKYLYTSGTSKCIKKILTKLKREIDSNKIILENNNIWLWPMGTLSRQKNNVEILPLNHVLDKLNIHRTFYPKARNYTFSSSANGTCSKIDHVLGH